MKTTFTPVAVAMMAFLMNATCIQSSAQSIYASGPHSLFVCSDETAWGTGWNNMGQLGTGTNIASNVPVQATSLSGITAVTGGLQFSLFLKNDGTVWGSGTNGDGQLGDGTVTPRYTPVQANNLTGIVAISAGWYHSIYLKNDGTVWSCGGNGYGQLGIGSTTDQLSPVQIPGLSGIVAIDAGAATSLFLKYDGTVWACGDNVQGELGIGSTGNIRDTAVQITALSGIVAVMGGAEFSLFIKNDSTVWSCGHNDRGQLGDGTYINRSTPVQVTSLSGIIAVSGGGEHALFLKSDSTVWACGRNLRGQLGDGTNTNRPTPVQITALSGIKAVSAGGDFNDGESLFLKSDGTVWACGANSIGQLGDSSNVNTNVPVLTNPLCYVSIGISENNTSGGFTIYPNPSSGNFTIENNDLKIEQVDIYNSLGEIVRSGNTNNESRIDINLENHPAGIYFVRATMTGKVITQTIILQR